jgi:predicted aspartyl protease
MEVAHVNVALRGLRVSNGTYEADFLVDTGATDCLAPAAKLRQIGVQPIGAVVYELADGTKH